MAAQWISLAITAVLAITSIVIGVYQSGQSKSAATSAENVRANISELTVKILDRIDSKLDDYVRQQNYKDYIESHGKEHKTIEQEMTRLRDWREGVEKELIRMRARLKMDDES